MYIKIIAHPPVKSVKIVFVKYNYDSVMVNNDDLIKGFEIRIDEIKQLRGIFINWNDEIKNNSKIDKSVKDKVESLAEEVNKELFIQRSTRMRD